MDLEKKRSDLENLLENKIQELNRIEALRVNLTNEIIELRGKINLLNELIAEQETKPKEKSENEIQSIQKKN